MRSCCDRLQWTLGTRHTDRDDMQFKVVFLVALISFNTIWIISTYLAQNWAVSQWLSFRTSDSNALYLYCLFEQIAKVDRSHYIISLSHHKWIRNLIYCWVLILALSPCYILIYMFRRWCIDKLGVFHANQISMCLDPHLN